MPKCEELSVWFVFSPYFRSFFYFIFYQDSSEGTGNHYFSCFPLLLSHEHSFSLSRFLPLFFNRSICIPHWQLIKLVLLGDLHFICIFIDAVKLQLLTFISKWHCEDLSSYQTITLLLQSERLNKVRLTPVSTTIYLSYLPNPTPTTYHLSVYQNV